MKMVLLHRLRLLWNTTDSEKRYYIGKEKNMEACNSQIETVFESYAQNVGIELEK